MIASVKETTDADAVHHPGRNPVETVLDVAAWPGVTWRLAGVLRNRFREDRLGLTAGSLTFTTLISLVPLLTVGLAAFTAFPQFAAFQQAIERFLFQNLVPDGIARPVLSALTRFAGQASQLGAWSLAMLVVTSLALLMTIDRSLNDLWRVRRRRSLAQRVLMYWALLTLGPLVLGASLTLTSWVLSASRGWVGELPGGLGMIFETIQFLLVAGGLAAFFHGVPHAPVQWSHAWVGGVVFAVSAEVAKSLLGWYLTSVSPLRSIYGAFSVVPILLLWVYLMWVLVLLCAVLVAEIPRLGLPAPDQAGVPGHRLGRALRLLAALRAARNTPGHGLSEHDLARQVGAAPEVVESLLEILIGLGWVGRLEGLRGNGRCVLLADLQQERAGPLIERLLLARSALPAGAEPALGLYNLRLSDLIPP